MENKLIGSGDAAKLLGVKRWKLIQLLESGKLSEPTFKLPGRRLFTEDDIKSLREELVILKTKNLKKKAD